MRDRFSHLPDPACGGADHTFHRRKFLQGVAGAGAFSLMSWGGLFSLPAFAEQAKREQKHCILLFLCGAPSQFETWDPKPGRPSGGPFGSIPTKIPGVHFSSLMPKCASIAGTAPFNPSLLATSDSAPTWPRGPSESACCSSAAMTNRWPLPRASSA